MTLSRRHLSTLLAIALIVRLLSLGAYPLMDTTEARYGEMARLMVETGNWLTPQFDYGVPFWGKPPLFTWISATGIELFGSSEFAVRVPHWIAGLATILIVAYMAGQKGINARIAAVVLATCGIFAIASGAVMTDMVLTFSITLTMTAFHLGWSHSNTTKRLLWGYVGFIGLALGLLAKGPVTIVLVALAIGPWMILQHGITGAFVQLWRRFPLVKGSILMLVIALPWYILAERATPGFLDYFIVGEHFKRFTVSGWEGDLYGSAHDQPRGTIWLYWLTSSAPWSFILLPLLWKRKVQIKAQAKENPGLVSYLILWMIAPLVLFTFAGNILPAYVLPGVPAMGVLVALLLKNGDESWFRKVALITPVLLIGALVYLSTGVSDKRSDKVLFSTADKDIPTFYVGKRPFSGQFYSYGQAKKYSEQDSVLPEWFYLIGNKDKVTALAKAEQYTCTQESQSSSGRGRYICIY